MRMLCLGLAFAAAAAELTTEESKKEIRMKSTRQLKDILKELDIKHPVSIAKEDLREFALSEDAMNRYYALPGKSKPKRKARSSGVPNLDAKADAMFDNLDVNKDGTLTDKEIDAMISGLGMSGQAKEAAAQGHNIFDMMDVDKNGKITRDELRGFMTAMQQLAADGKVPGMDIPGVTSTPTSGSASGAKKKATPIDEANQLFNSLDGNMDGQLSKSELDAFWGQAGVADQAKQADAMGRSLFDGLDSDSDGSVRPDEFKAFMKQLSGNKAKPTKAEADDDDLPAHDDL